MNFKDQIIIKMQAGRGGNGAVAYTQKKHGFLKKLPDGGNGGNGGNVVFQTDHNFNHLGHLQLQPLIKGIDGQAGSANNAHGRNGKAMIIKIPLGTILVDHETQEILADFNVDGEMMIIAHGGKGGKGNKWYAAQYQNSSISETGHAGEHKVIECQLKTLADIGLVGLPNVGKSTILSLISNAKPKIANYPFTTLIPNLGILKDSNITIADLPGLIDHADEGKGLGLDFLKHIERCALLALVIEWQPTFAQCYADYQLLMNMLIKYQPGFNTVGQLLIITKIDIADQDVAVYQQQFLAQGITNVGVSIYNQSLVDQLLITLLDLYHQYQDHHSVLNQAYALKTSYKSYIFQAPVDDIIITKPKAHWWDMKGDWVVALIKTVTPLTHQNITRLNEILRKKGIFAQLIKQGIQEHDTVVMYDVQWTWKDQTS